MAVTAEELYFQAKQMVSKTVLNNLSPILSKQISQHTGVEVTGTFMSDDATDRGEMSYVTVLRNPNTAVAHDGLGFAWRKGDGNTYNVYFVDSDALTEDVYIGQNTIVADGSVGNFLMAGRRTILTDGVTKYDFKLRISSTLGMRLWIVAQGTSMVETPYIAVTNEGGYLLDRGAQVDGYTPNAGSAYAEENWGLLYFGIAVMNTRNYQWWYKDVKIVSIDTTIPMVLFQLDAPVANFLPSKPFRVLWNGAGKWGSDLAPNYGAGLYIYNSSSSAWELVGTHGAWFSGIQSSVVISKSYSDITNYRDPNNFVNLLATPLSASDSAQIITDYVEIDNVAASGIHQGNMVDIYYNDPTNIIELTATTTLTDGLIAISKATTPTVNFPIQEILRLTDTLGTTFEPGIDYIVNYNNPSAAFSNEANITIYKNGGGSGTIYMTYRYAANGESMQTLVDSTSYRSPGVDNLIKVVPPVVVTINALDYKSGLDEENMRTAIASFINSQTTSLEISDLINFLYTQGATYVDLSTLDITIRAYDYTGAMTENGTAVSTKYTLPNLTRFYTCPNEMGGLSKLS